MKATFAFASASTLNSKQLIRLREIRESNYASQDLGKLEREYQAIAQRQTFADLMQIYAPENASRLEIAYPSFTGELGEHAGDDDGRGLHVIKRLTLATELGTRTVEVNEQWPENPLNLGLLLPDEIRIKSQVGDTFVFDSVRLAWGDTPNSVELFRRTLYRWDTSLQANVTVPMRSPVTAPFSCLGCHDQSAGFSEKFLKPGEAADPVRIVPKAYFAKPFKEMAGYQEYIQHLVGKAPSDFIDSVKADLENPQSAFEVPGLYARLQMGKSVSWIEADLPVPAIGHFLFWGQHGIYRYRGQLYQDGILDFFEGRYRWWEPQTVVPSRVVNPHYS